MSFFNMGKLPKEVATDQKKYNKFSDYKQACNRFFVLEFLRRKWFATYYSCSS